MNKVEGVAIGHLGFNTGVRGDRTRVQLLHIYGNPTLHYS
jgi:hypothetical protein